MNSPEAPVPSKSEPTGARPVLPSGIEAGLLGGAAVAVTFLAVLAVAVVAAVLPARRVTRIEISTALRAET